MLDPYLVPLIFGKLLYGNPFKAHVYSIKLHAPLGSSYDSRTGDSRSAATTAELAGA